MHAQAQRQELYLSIYGAVGLHHTQRLLLQALEVSQAHFRLYCLRYLAALRLRLQMSIIGGPGANIGKSTPAEAASKVQRRGERNILCDRLILRHACSQSGLGVWDMSSSVPKALHGCESRLRSPSICAIACHLHWCIHES